MRRVPVLMPEKYRSLIERAVCGDRQEALKAKQQLGAHIATASREGRSEAEALRRIARRIRL